jgi:hypothetical protein
MGKSARPVNGRPLWRAAIANDLRLALVVLGRLLDADVVIAGVEVDFLVGADLRILVDRQIFGRELVVLRRLRSGEGNRLADQPQAKETGRSSNASPRFLNVLKVEEPRGIEPLTFAMPLRRSPS